MAMGLARSGAETRQVEMVALDDLVAADDPYRRIEQLVSWRAVRAAAAPFYAVDGRLSVCPAVLLKLFVVCAVEGFGSMRETLRRAERDVAIRRFLGYGLSERLPSHATVSYAQCVRFAESSIFEQLFTQVLAACRAVGLLDGRRLLVDATHVEANAALRSLRGELAAAVEDEQRQAAPGASGTRGEQPEAARGASGTRGEQPEAAPGASGGQGEQTQAPGASGGQGEQPQARGVAAGGSRLRLAEPRSGPTPRRQATNATAVSRSDPEAKLRHKPGQRPHLVHRAQVAVDPQHRVIVGVRAEPATGHEGDALVGLVRRARWAGHAVAEVAADQGYAAAQTYDELAALGVEAYIPPQPRMATPQAQAARLRCRSAGGRAAAVARMSHAEGAISELKSWHGLARARSRGQHKLQIQLLLAATAVNLKRLLSHADAAEQAAAESGNARTATPHPADQTGDLLNLLRWCLHALAALKPAAAL